MEDENTKGIPEDENDRLIKIRKERITSFLKNKFNWIVYLLLGIIVFIAVRIRTGNLPGLRDVTTGTWTLGPDLDPFLFLRYAKEIVETGTLAAVDMMRYVPLGFNTGEGFVLHYYLIAWFHNIFGPILGTESVTHSAVLFPVFMFALTVIAFFFFSREVFVKSMGRKKANLIGLIASFFLTVMPVLLPRTIAGIPEKESAAFFFMFAAFYFFLKSWKSKKLKTMLGFALIAGIFTGSMGLIWGGYTYLFLILGPAFLVAFLIGQTNKKKFYAYSLWMFSSFALIVLFSSYPLDGFIRSFTTSFAMFVFFIVLVHYTIMGSKMKKVYKVKNLRNLPPKFLSIIFTLIFSYIVTSLTFGFQFFPNRISLVYSNLIKPAQSRLILTVAENRQPYFTEWANNFGPLFRGVPVSFWIFTIGSVFLFLFFVKSFQKKERRNLVLAYVLFLVFLIFTRYSSGSIFNGENFISLLLYTVGFVLFFGMFGYYSYRHVKSGESSRLERIDFSLLVLFLFLIMGIISARGLIRLVMVLVPPASMVLGYFLVSSYYYGKNSLNKENKILILIGVGFVVFMIVFAGYSLYNSSNQVSGGYVPSVYTHQWQRAMEWVRENTAEDAVFGHWWDYGYWVQSIGERATVLDGGNLISYWNHLMGRHVLTGTSTRDALEFLYAHDATHLLIDSTDIGKYGAFSSIGSDETYDRRSWIPTFRKDNSQTSERKNSIVSIYPGGSPLDDDIIYTGDDGVEIFLPGQKTIVIGVIVEIDLEDNVKSVEGVFALDGNQHRIPLRYYYDKVFVDNGIGAEVGVFLYPRIENAPGGGVNIEDRGALLFLNKRVVNSQLARLYLYGEENEFKTVRVESDFLVENLRAQGVNLGEFAQYQGFRGPIKIWEIDYPDNMKLKEEYLSRAYPESLRVVG